MEISIMAVCSFSFRCFWNGLYGAVLIDNSLECYLADARYVHCSQPGKREAVPLAELEIEDK